VKELVRENAVELVVPKVEQWSGDHERPCLADALDRESVRVGAGRHVNSRKTFQTETDSDHVEPTEEARLLRGCDVASAKHRERDVSAAEHRGGKDDEERTGWANSIGS